MSCNLKADSIISHGSCNGNGTDSQIQLQSVLCGVSLANFQNGVIQILVHSFGTCWGAHQRTQGREGTAGARSRGTQSERTDCIRGYSCSIMPASALAAASSLPSAHCRSAHFSRGAETLPVSIKSAVCSATVSCPHAWGHRRTRQRRRPRRRRRSDNMLDLRPRTNMLMDDRGGRPGDDNVSRRTSNHHHRISSVATSAKTSELTRQTRHSRAQRLRAARTRARLARSRSAHTPPSAHCARTQVSFHFVNLRMSAHIHPCASC